MLAASFVATLLLWLGLWAVFLGGLILGIVFFALAGLMVALAVWTMPPSPVEPPAGRPSAEAPRVPLLFRFLVKEMHNSTDMPEARLAAIWATPGRHRTFMAVAGAMLWSLLAIMAISLIVAYLVVA